MSCDPPTLKEPRRAVNKLKSRETPGRCGIYAEMLKAGEAAALLWLHILLCTIWNRGIIATGHEALSFQSEMERVIPRSVTTTGDYPFPRAKKVLATQSSVQGPPKLLTHQRHEQSSFTPKKTTVDRILALRVLTDCLRQFCTGLLATYVDFGKAFDSLNRDVL